MHFGTIWQSCHGDCPKNMNLEFCSQIILLLCKAQPYGASEAICCFVWIFCGKKQPKHQVTKSWDPGFTIHPYPSNITKLLSTMRLPACLNPNLSRPMFPTLRPPWRIETSSTPRGSKHCPIESTPQLQRPNHLELEPWNWPTLRLFPWETDQLLYIYTSKYKIS